MTHQSSSPALIKNFWSVLLCYNAYLYFYWFSLFYRTFICISDLSSILQRDDGWKSSIGCLLSCYPQDCFTWFISPTMPLPNAIHRISDGFPSFSSCSQLPNYCFFSVRSSESLFINGCAGRELLLYVPDWHWPYRWTEQKAAHRRAGQIKVQAAPVAGAGFK